MYSLLPHDPFINSLQIFWGKIPDLDLSALRIADDPDPCSEGSFELKNCRSSIGVYGWGLFPLPWCWLFPKVGHHILDLADREPSLDNRVCDLFLSRG